MEFLKKIDLPDKAEWKRQARTELLRQIPLIEKTYRVKFKFSERKFDKWVDHVYEKAKGKRFFGKTHMKAWFLKKLAKLSEIRKVMKAKGRL